MSTATFDEIIDFAIGREKAAVAFYAELENLSSFAAQKSTMGEFKAMETGHVLMLEGIKSRGKVNLPAVQIGSLGLVINLETKEVSLDGLNYQDILRTGIGREDRSETLYLKLAASAADPEAKSALELLALDEGRHKRYFEELYEKDIARDN